MGSEVGETPVQPRECNKGKNISKAKIYPIPSHGERRTNTSNASLGTHEIAQRRQRQEGGTYPYRKSSVSRDRIPLGVSATLESRGSLLPLSASLPNRQCPDTLVIGGVAASDSSKIAPFFSTSFSPGAILLIFTHPSQPDSFISN